MIFKKYLSRFFPVLLIFVLASSCNQNQDTTLLEGPIFKQIPKLESGINFVNSFSEKAANNFHNNNIIFAGGGVAIGDLNNDGLQDIFFVSNENSHALYINKGKFKFENIIESSKIEHSKGWATGVSMVDINQDGYLDIYINKGGHANIPRENKANELFINNGDLTFSEQAKKYGLQDFGSSTMSSFFDYDGDGDLDAYVLNYLTIDEAPERIINVIEDRNNPPNELYSDHFYIRESPNTFVDATKETKILNYGHGLGIAVSDFNNDNKPDIYITNDFEQSNFMYINDGKSFRDVIKFSIGHVSYFAMGVDAADINNDGFIDIFELDMAPKDRKRSIQNMTSMNRGKFEQLEQLTPQYMRNNLHLNRGFGYKFSEIAQFSGVNKTDWSWATIIQDLDDDGLKDIFVTNGIVYDVSDRDYAIQIDSISKGQGDVITMNDVKKIVPTTPIQNYAFKNNGDLTFSNNSTIWGFDFKGFSNGLSYGDLDNDGDLDLVINNINESPIIYQNTSKERGQNYINFKFHGPKGNLNGIGAKVTIHTKDGIQFQEMYTSRGFQSSSQNIVHFGIGSLKKIDKVEIVWPNNKMQTITNVTVNNKIDVYQKNATEDLIPPKKDLRYFVGASRKSGIISTHKEDHYDDFKDEILLPHKLSQMGPFTAVGDVNGDKVEDLYVGGSANYPGQLFVSQKEQPFIAKDNPVFEKDKKHEDMGAHFFDYDGDGDLDLYVVSGSNQFDENSPKYQDRLYLNDGKGNFTRSNSIPNETQSGSCVISADFDKDGDLDIFIGGRIKPGKYPYHSKSILLENNNGTFRNITNKVAKGLEDIGMVTSAIWSDYDKDGDQDLLVVGEWMSIHVFENNNGNFNDISLNLGLKNTSGWWNKIVEWDFDKDGDLDYVVGNIGLNHKFSASVDKPFQVLCNDFDNTGNLDIVLAFEYENEIVPVRGRDCTSEQMPFITKKYPSFNAFGNAKISDMFDEDKLSSSLNYKVQLFASIILVNENGTFVIRELPTAAQLSAVNGILPFDIDNDGIEELLLVGNMHQTEAETSKADASVGVVLKYENNSFRSLEMSETGWFCPGDAKDLSVLNYKIPIFIVTNNNNKTQVFALKDQ